MRRCCAVIECLAVVRSPSWVARWRPSSQDASEASSVPSPRSVMLTSHRASGTDHTRVRARKPRPAQADGQGAGSGSSMIRVSPARTIRKRKLESRSWCTTSSFGPRRRPRRSAAGRALAQPGGCAGRCPRPCSNRRRSGPGRDHLHPASGVDVGQDSPESTGQGRCCPAARSRANERPAGRPQAADPELPRRRGAVLGPGLARALQARFQVTPTEIAGGDQRGEREQQAHAFDHLSGPLRNSSEPAAAGGEVVATGASPGSGCGVAASGAGATGSSGASGAGATGPSGASGAGATGSSGAAAAAGSAGSSGCALGPAGSPGDPSIPSIPSPPCSPGESGRGVAVVVRSLGPALLRQAVSPEPGGLDGGNNCPGCSCRCVRAAATRSSPCAFHTPLIAPRRASSRRCASSSAGCQSVPRRSRSLAVAPALRKQLTTSCSRVGVQLSR